MALKLGTFYNLEMIKKKHLQLYILHGELLLKSTLK